MAEPPSSSEEESVCHQLQLRAFRRLLPASSPVAALPLSGSLTSPLPGEAAGRRHAAWRRWQELQGRFVPAGRSSCWSTEVATVLAAT